MPNQQLPNGLAAAPYIEQYFGAWAMHEPEFNALRGVAQSINLQLHLETHATPEAREARAADARHGIAYEVTRGGLAIIELRGTMTKHVGSMSAGASTVLARRELRAAAADDQVAGIMLLIDSPGGTVAGIDDLARDIAAAGKAKPVHAYIEDLGASAAYWAASQAARISTGPTAIVGSIGVFQVVHDISRMAEQQGVEVHVVKFGAFKGSAVPGTKVTEEKLAECQALVDAYGADFVAAVSQGRKLPIAQARELADGRVHKGKAALDLQLVDGIESFDEAMRQLAAATSKGPTRAKGKAVSNEELKAALAQQRAAIVAACPGAPEAFVDKQLAAGATAEDAGRAYMSQLQADNAAATKAREEAEAKAAEAEKAKAEAEQKAAAKPARGVDPVKTVADGGKGDDQVSGDANEEWVAKVNAFISGEETGVKMSRPKAVLAAARKYPELRAAAVAQANG